MVDTVAQAQDVEVELDYATPRAYRIGDERLPGLLEQIEKLNKRAARLGVAPIRVEVVRHDENHYRNEETGIEAVYCTTSLFVIGENPRYEGWELAATLVDFEGQNLVNTVPGMSVPTSYRNSDPTRCDHCGARRKRQKTMVLYNRDSNTYTQVGTSCIRDFLGGVSPQALAAWAEITAAVGGMVLDAEEESDWHGGGGRRVPEAYAMETFLSYAAEEIRRYGWVSRSKAREDYLKVSTASAALIMLEEVAKHPRPAWLAPEEREWTYQTDRGVWSTVYQPSDAAIEHAEKALAWGIDWLHIGDEQFEVESLNDYQYNLRVALGVTGHAPVTRRTSGLVASLLSAYTREMEREVERKREEAQNSNSVHVGEVGKRATFTVTVEHVRYIENEFGSTGIVSMRDVDGNVLKTFASGSFKWSEPGQRFVIKGTVKGHEWFRNAAETVLSRVTVVEELAAEGAASAASEV